MSRRFVLGISVAFGLLACSEAPAPLGVSAGPRELAGQLVLTGSSTVAPLIAEMGRRFEGLHPAVRIDVQTGGSSRGIRDAREGTADIGMASRALAAGESRDLQAHTIAEDAIGLVVHADNPVSSLSVEEVRGIYHGQITSWRDVGGRDARITVVDKAAGRATRDVFVARFALDELELRPQVIIGDNEQGVKVVAGDPDAIAYVSIGATAYHARAGTPIRPLRVRGVSPGSVSRPLNLVTRPEVGGLTRTFLNYCRSDAVHDLVRDLYFAPIP